MNSNLIDKHLIDLLRIPAEQRTQANISEATNQIRGAALLDTVPLILVHQEHSKLAAIVEFLAAELGMDMHDTTLCIRESQSHSLAAFMSGDSDGSRLMGFGKTAEEALKDLHPMKTSNDAA